MHNIFITFIIHTAYQGNIYINIRLIIGDYNIILDFIVGI